MSAHTVYRVRGAPYARRTKQKEKSRVEYVRYSVRLFSGKDEYFYGCSVRAKSDGFAAEDREPDPAESNRGRGLLDGQPGFFQRHDQHRDQHNLHDDARDGRRNRAGPECRKAEFGRIQSRAQKARRTPD